MALPYGCHHINGIQKAYGKTICLLYGIHKACIWFRHMPAMWHSYGTYTTFYTVILYFRPIYQITYVIWVTYGVNMTEVIWLIARWIPHECHMNFMWYSSSRVPYHFCYIDTICNPYTYDGCIKSIWASYGNATGEGADWADRYQKTAVN